MRTVIIPNLSLLPCLKIACNVRNTRTKPYIEAACCLKIYKDKEFDTYYTSLEDINAPVGDVLFDSSQGRGNIMDSVTPLTLNVMGVKSFSLAKRRVLIRLNLIFPISPKTSIVRNLFKAKI